MKRVLIIAHFCSEFDGSGNNRFNYLVERLSSENKEIHVELMTSDFSHNNKKKRKKVDINVTNYKLTLIEEPIYKKNISIKRFFSHYVMARNLEKMLTKIGKPDVIYCAVPSLDVAYTAAKYATDNKIKFIIDVQDLWPEAYKLLFKLPIFSDVLYYPMARKAKKIYQSADNIIAVSETYLEKALQYNDNAKDNAVVFLGTDLELFDKLKIENKHKKENANEIWLAYVGTLGHSYDLTIVIQALRILKEKDIRLIVMGDGPLKEKFELLAKKYSVKVDFMGRLPYAKMVGVLSSCDIAINPISKGAAQSIINKHGDYAAAGLPVINTQESAEYQELVMDYSMGLNCDNNSPEDVAEKILYMVENTDKRHEMAANSRLLAEKKFDRQHTYKRIIELICEGVE